MEGRGLTQPSQPGQARLVFVGEKENGYPCFGWNSYPCYIHVVVQQVEFGLQRQDETAGKKKKMHPVSNKSRQKTPDKNSSHNASLCQVPPAAQFLKPSDQQECETERLTPTRSSEASHFKA